MRLLALFTIILLLAPLAVTAEPDNELDKFSRAFLESVKSGDFARLRALTPTLIIWRKLSPEATKDKSDDELSKAVEKNRISKLRSDFDHITKAAREKKVDLSQLQFVSFRTEPLDEKSGILGLEVNFTFNGRPDSFPLSIVKVDGHYYVMEILLSVNSFRKL